MADGIAIVGMACTYPDARTPRELWENVLAGRRSFRQIPSARMCLDDYWSDDRAAVDRTYGRQAALITNFEFDRARYRISAEAYRSSDPSHWLALDCAAAALRDARFDDNGTLDRRGTGVLVGNTLTGDYSRAASMRLRWPYVRRVVGAVLAAQEIDAAKRAAILGSLAEAYKRPFPPMDSESLAGWLSNTIAGRICNHFGLQGGGYVVDGACASSLLAVANGCRALASGELNVALVGGVDISIDPFELVGFARAGALAAEEMRVYDEHATGFWPGEGCGFAVLMREADARAGGRRVYAVIRGWGVSSDGEGGLTRPEVNGQLLALERAYARAGYGIDTAAYLEGHGTGTGVGDHVELTALTRARLAAGASGKAVIGSIKTNIGHTKAAAGIAGLIKTVMAVDRQVLPPTIGCVTPKEQLVGEHASLVTLARAAPWPREARIRAGVSAMGFGGINVHVTLEGDRARRTTFDRVERRCIGTAQDAELIALGADSWIDLLGRLRALLARADALSRAELTDLAVSLQRSHRQTPCRAALVCEDPRDLRRRLERAVALVERHDSSLDPAEPVFVGGDVPAPRIGFLFPGQGSPYTSDGGSWTRAFARVRSLYHTAPARTAIDAEASGGAQPAIARATLAGLRVLERLGIEARVAVGHSLGELLALHWGGALDEPTLLRLIEARSRAFAALPGHGGMAGLSAGADRVRTLIAGTDACIAAFNSPSQTVVSGSVETVAFVVDRARREGIQAAVLPVAHAFHSPMMVPAASIWREALDREILTPPVRTIFSSVTGRRLTSSDTLRELLWRQVTEPVRFAEAIAGVLPEIDLAIEVGPANVLSHLAHACGHAAAVSVDAGGQSLAPLLTAVAAAYSLGAPVRLEQLAAGRFARPFAADAPRFFASPCEDAPADAEPVHDAEPSSSGEEASGAGMASAEPSDNPMAIALDLVACRSQLPLSAIRPEHRLLADLHFNSITAAQIAVDLAARLEVPAPVAPTQFAEATIQEVVEALLARRGDAPSTANTRMAGIDSWVRVFREVTVAAPPVGPAQRPDPGTWQICADAAHELLPSLRREAARRPARGTIWCLCSHPRLDDWMALVAAARDVARRGGGETFVIVHDRDGGEALGRSLAQEAPDSKIAVVQVDFDAPDAARRIVDEAMAVQRFAHVRIDRDGSRRSLAFEVAAPEATRFQLDANDVLVVTGGARGITAECALALARRTGVALGLIGRGDPGSDGALEGTLSRMRAAGVRHRYERADVCDPAAVKRAVDQIAEALGPITGIVHAAAANRPVLLADLDDRDARDAIATKVAGLEALLAAVPTDQLRLLVAFGSLIARSGMRGDAHYAVANEALRLAVDAFGRAEPQCRCLTIEWSAWGGTGMGARLGLAGLERQGVTPLTDDQGVSGFLDLLNSSASGAFVVASRFGGALQLTGPALPLARFIENARVWYPGIELIADTDLSAETDPYVTDHVLGGDRVMPAVIGIEAMVQSAAALRGVPPGRPARLRDVRFDQSIVIPKAGRRTVRVAALVRSDGAVEVALRCDATGFAVDHFALRCEFDAVEALEGSPRPSNGKSECANAGDLYSELLFQRGRFKRLRGYHRLAARHCVAELAAAPDASYFNTYLPATLWLGDPGARDAVVHAIQACHPTRRLIPTRVDALTVSSSLSGGCLVEAIERHQHGLVYVYDVEVREASGRVVERWEGLHLRDVGDVSFRDGMPAILLEPWVTREWERRGGAADDLTILQSSDESPGSGLEMLRTAAPVARRADGRPVPLAPGRYASATHDSGASVGVIANAPVGCDLQAITARARAEWHRLLGADDAVVAEYVMTAAGEAFDSAATRLWAAREALLKVGASADAPLIVDECRPSMVWFRSGDRCLATVRLRMSSDDAILGVVMPQQGRNP